MTIISDWMWYLLYYYWIDTSDGGLLFLEGIIKVLLTQA
jgi:hypothetical protein